jgi:hypothetical protein
MTSRGAVAHHRIEPAARAAAMGVEAGRAAPDPYESIVDRFFRKILPKQDAARDADHARRLAVVDHLQRSAVAGSTARQCGGKLQLALLIGKGGVAPTSRHGAISGHVYALA